MRCGMSERSPEKRMKKLISLLWLLLAAPLRRRWHGPAQSNWTARWSRSRTRWCASSSTSSPDGTRKEFVLYSVKKGSDKIVALFPRPGQRTRPRHAAPGRQHVAVHPQRGKPVRITSLQSVTGGIFNNADILALEFSVEYAVEKVDEGAAAYTLSLKARTGDVAYDRLTMKVDKKTTLPISIDCYAASAADQDLDYRDIKDFGAA